MTETPDQRSALQAAMQSEDELAARAAEVRGDNTQLDRALFLELWPLLREPIPAAFIQTVGRVEGKPYDSTGIRSVQVLIDRMNNVLTPLWWWDEVEYEQDGKLCTVTVSVGDRSGENGILLARSSRGGVQRGSSIGNVYKGSYTNAAKLAFARVGPGHEVYLGAVDLDPDVSEDLANQEPAVDAEPDGIGRELARKLVDRAWELGVNKSLQLAGSHAAGTDVGDCSTKAKATTALATLTYAQAEKVDAWLNRKADEQLGDSKAQEQPDA
jgi:hypothetical protein